MRLKVGEGAVLVTAEGEQLLESELNATREHMAAQQSQLVSGALGAAPRGGGCRTGVVSGACPSGGGRRP